RARGRRAAVRRSHPRAGGRPERLARDHAARGPQARGAAAARVRGPSRLEAAARGLRTRVHPRTRARPGPPPDSGGERGPAAAGGPGRGARAAEAPSRSASPPARRPSFPRSRSPSPPAFARALPSAVRRRGPVVALDGPSGAGKSTAGRELAARLGYTFIDTGAMYRALALKALRSGAPLDSEPSLVALARDIRIELLPGRVRLDGEDVTTAI